MKSKPAKKSKVPKSRNPPPVPKKVSNMPAVVKQTTLELSSPTDILMFSNTLKEFIEKAELSTVINGKSYANVDGWKFLGSNFGLNAVASKPVAKHLPGQYIIGLYSIKVIRKKDNSTYEKEVLVYIGFATDKEIVDEVRSKNKISKELTKPYYAYECECNIYRHTDLKHEFPINRGTGFCSNLEELKFGFDEYAVMSMSETRSIGKGYRNMVGFVMKAAGFSDTPKEEMEGVKTEEVTYESPSSGLPKLDSNSEEYDKVLQKLTTGEWDLRYLEEMYDLNDTQRATIQTVLKNV